MIRFVPTLVNALSGYDVVEVATGKAHALFLTACGKVFLPELTKADLHIFAPKVFAAGSNENGQCGQGRKTGNLDEPKMVGVQFVSMNCSNLCLCQFSVCIIFNCNSLEIKKGVTMGSQ